MLCSEPSLWPKPQLFQIENKQFSVINNNNIKFNNGSGESLGNFLQDIANIFKKNVEDIINNDVLEGEDMVVEIIFNIRSNVDKVKLYIDEGYDLDIKKNSDKVLVNISAENYFGARHALETLSQLIWFDEVTNELKILHDVHVKDFPSFPYRGLMVDTARNYFPMSLLKKVVDGMAASKLNVFHLHLTDSVSFPLVLPNIPELAYYGAYGSDMIYTVKDIKDLIEYSRVRGIRVILEIDAPSHMNAGWSKAFDDQFVMCTEESPSKGQLNPDNKNVLRVLEDIYKDLLEMNENNDVFHLGGDEVDLNCWGRTQAASRYSDIKEFWVNYANEIINTLKIANEDQYPDNIVIWSSPLTDSRYVNKLVGNITLQFWFGNPQTFLATGKKIIYSTVGHWYLDCGFGPWNPSMTHGVCDPYTPWQKFYTYTPWNEYGHREQALGGEVCLWTEQVDVDNLETRIWPRAAAFAERVWKNPGNFDNYDVYTRLVAHRERLLKRGIKNAGLWPRYCSQNPGKCEFT